MFTLNDQRSRTASLRTAVLGGLLLFTAFASDARAQQAGISSPGQLMGSNLGQVTRFDNAFNPAISFAVDFVLDYVDFDGGSQDGLDTNARRAELLLADWIDPNAFSWITIAYEGEEIVLDEAAIEYVGLPGNHSLRAGRFFLDFGKQMQNHIEELRTTERPLVLRDYLGEELAADGLQWDYWTPTGDASLVRWSVGAFGDLSGGGHGHGEEEGHEPELEVADRKEVSDIGFTGRLTALTEVGRNGTLQGGVSARYLSDFALHQETSDVEVEGLSNVIYGLDLTYGWLGDEGMRTWTVGGELLFFDGELSAELNDNGTPGDTTDDSLDVFDDSVVGSYAYVDHRWNRFNSAGLQYSTIQEPEPGKPRVTEYDAYYTRQLSEFLRLRFGLTFADFEESEDSVRFAIQLTGFIGPHGHAVNW